MEKIKQESRAKGHDFIMIDTFSHILKCIENKKQES